MNELMEQMTDFMFLSPESQYKRPVPSPIIFNNYVEEETAKINYKNQRFFSYIVYLHQLLGQTYGGWQPNKSFSRFRRYSLISYEICAIVLTIAVYFLIEETMTARLFESNTRKVITSGIIRLAGSVSMLQMVFIRLMFVYNGNELIDSINVHFKSINSPINYRPIFLFGIYYGICQGIGSLMVFMARDIDVKDLTNANFLGLCGFYFFVGFFGSFQIGSITVLAMILSKILVFKIEEQKKSIRDMISISQICRQTLEIRDTMDSMNRMIGFALFIKIVFNGMIMSSAFCALADNLNRPSLNYYIIAGLIFTIIPQNIDLFIACQSSQQVFDAMEVMCKTTEDRISRTEVMTTSDKQKYDLILSLRDRICFRAAQVLEISRRTYLYVLNLTATYAIILIQTD